MEYVEILGQSGVGKSTVLSKLCTNNKYYPGVRTSTEIKKGAYQRKLLNLDTKFRFLIKWIPYELQHILSHFFEYRFRRQALLEFLHNYPTYFDIVPQAIELISHNNPNYEFPAKAYHRFQSRAEDYQLSITTKTNKEILCLEEGLIQRAEWVLTRAYRINNVSKEKSKKFISAYIDLIPIPDQIILLDVPPEECINRKMKRGDNIHTKDRENILSKQRNRREVLDILMTVLDDYTETNVVRNGESVNDTVSEIMSIIQRKSEENI